MSFLYGPCIFFRNFGAIFCILQGFHCLDMCFIYISHDDVSLITYCQLGVFTYTLASYIPYGAEKLRCVGAFLQIHRSRGLLQVVHLVIVEYGREPIEIR